MSVIILNGNKKPVSTRKQDAQPIKDLSSGGITHVSEPTELGEFMTNLNNDKIDPNTKMTSIDMNTRVYNHMERGAWTVIDTLVGMEVYPPSCLLITRQLKRLSVSLEGQGRKEAVEAAVGKREMESNKGFMDKIKDNFKSKPVM